jgi:lysophospholipase L1-like esterase
MRIVALGDSTTAGTPFFQSPLEAPPHGRGDPRGQFAYWLMDMRPDWYILNRGINGQRSDQIAARFERDVLAERPEAVIIIGGVNDVYAGLPASHVKTVLARLYERARQASIPVVAGSIVPYNTATPQACTAMRDINDWIRQEAGRHAHMRFADTRAATAAPGDPDRLAGSPDNLHPDVDGYRRMAEALAPALAALPVIG